MDARESFCFIILINRDNGCFLTIMITIWSLGNCSLAQVEGDPPAWVPAPLFPHCPGLSSLLRKQGIKSHGHREVMFSSESRKSRNKEYHSYTQRAQGTPAPTLVSYVLNVYQAAFHPYSLHCPGGLLLCFCDKELTWLHPCSVSSRGVKTCVSFFASQRRVAL